MNFADPAIDGLLHGWTGHPNKASRAQGQNLRFETRLTGPRGASINQFLVPPPATLEELTERYVDYVKERVITPESGTPETFTALNMTAAVRVSPDVTLVRVENLRSPLEKAGVAFEDLEAALAATDGLSRDLIARFLREWNTRGDIWRNPVSFAAIRSEVIDEVNAPDWPERLRDRLGLAQHKGAAAPIPVALIQYEAADVSGPGPLFCAPTVADTKPWEIYFPTPQQATYGCPMSLEPRDYDDALVAEILHPRIQYQPHHLVKVGWIASDPPVHGLETLRNNHLWALRIALNVESFGQEL
ncbi:MAG TPA: hypothetical protein VD906_00885 [Caulobacteraceae bacterium]|nr:hypothetical protein [Caulobacteraceae bacterium]